MGTWGYGIFDNDSALDTLADLVESVPLDKSPAHLAAGLGLRLWIQPSSLAAHPETYRAILRQHAAWVHAFPPNVRKFLEEIEADPEAAAEPLGSRPEAIRGVVGGYCDGPMNKSLLTCDGAGEVIEELATACRQQLDEFADSPTVDLYEAPGNLAALGLLVVLTEVGVTCRAKDVKRWRAAFNRLLENTHDEREFWDVYASRVKAGFQVLAATAT